MAILKHLSVHNKYYQDAVTYFMFQHDNHARPIYNDQHKKILRENFLIDAINTGVWSYSTDCQIANQRWKKNREEREVKSHHFIISFPKEDRDEHGLTLEMAQELGMKFARKHFGGHQCVVATHDDGSNHSGNIHLHIAFNSLRIKDTEPPEYSNLDRDCKAGFKFQASDKCIRYLKADLERMCRERGLSQIPLNRPAKKKVTTKEYWAEHRGQDRLDQKNEAIRSIGGMPADTKFQTELSRIREAIDDAKKKCASLEDFKAILKREHHIEVTESRGRWSYLPEYRKRPITSRRLGADYSSEAVESFVAQRIREQQLQAAPEKRAAKKEQIPEPRRTIVEAVTIGRIIDLNDPKIQSSYSLLQWAKIQNLKTMSQSFNYLTENHLLNLDDLQATIEASKQDFKDNTQTLVKVEKRLREVNGLLKNLGVYHKFRPLYQQYMRSGRSPKLREKNIREILLYEGARKYLKEYQQEHHVSSVPGTKPLQEAKAKLTAQQQSLYDRRHKLKQSVKALEDGYRLLQQVEPVHRNPNLHRYVERE